MQANLFEENIPLLVPAKQQEERGAIFSQDRKYRYCLKRIWDTTKPKLMWIGFNPSNAGETDDDPTIESVRRITRFNSYGGFYMLNCYGIICELPEIVKKTKDPMGANLQYHDIIRPLVTNVVFAWGNFKEATEIAQDFIKRYPGALCIGKNKNGSPVHPLYQKEQSTLIKF